ncbi:MAG: pantoate--beta-alanine ligase [Ignavibacteria bacterium]
MKVIKEIFAIQNICLYFKRVGKTIGFVPTMGFLHEGHISLILKARDENDIVVVSIFVNPIQFLPNEDFEKYPRDFLRDYHLCKSAGVDYIFYPEPQDVFPDNYKTFVEVKNLSDILEGKYRPGHFRGVTTVIAKFMNIVMPDRLYLGQKDAQQAVILKKMLKDLNYSTEIRIGKTIREDSGLALSSRNMYLSDEEKFEASVLYKALDFGAKLIKESHFVSSEEVIDKMKTFIKERSPNCELQYIAITDNENLTEIADPANFKGEILISLAAFFRTTRLIDNIIVIKT